MSFFTGLLAWEEFKAAKNGITVIIEDKPSGSAFEPFGRAEIQLLQDRTQWLSSFIRL